MYFSHQIPLCALPWEGVNRKGLPPLSIDMREPSKRLAGGKPAERDRCPSKVAFDKLGHGVVSMQRGSKRDVQETDTHNPPRFCEACVETSARAVFPIGHHGDPHKFAVWADKFFPRDRGPCA